LSYRNSFLRPRTQAEGSRDHHRGLEYAIKAALVCAALGAGSNAAAANWEFAPRVEGGYRYSDNYRLDIPGAEIDVSGAELDGMFTVRTVDPRLQAEISPRVRSTYFPDESELDSTDYSLHASVADVTPRRRTGVIGDFSREDVLRSELPDVETGGDLGDPQAGDSGRVLQDNQRNYFRIQPFFGYDVSQRSRVELNAHYMQSEFDDEFVGVQQDYSELAGSVGYAFRYSERSTISFRGVVSQYDTDFKTDGYGGHAEWGHDFSPQSRMYIRLGAQQTEPENGQGETTVIGGLGGRWSSQRNALFLDLTRSVGPIAAGTVVERHQLRVLLDHDVSPRLSLLLGARASRDEEIEGFAARPTREYAVAEAGFEWRILRAFAITGTYNYRWQEYEDEPSDRSANGFMIGLVYEPKRPE
jgi:hypothetical protein